MGQFVFLAVCLMAFAATVTSQKNWVLLVAGSNNYVNYRHQADICHAYHIHHKNGIPDEQIVVMMYDDIAYNKENPFKGNIINKPNGPNVYPGVPKDYTGRHVNRDVFLAVLQGDKEKVKNLTGTYGKVIASGPNDNIFVYYSDHGGHGLIGMPTKPFVKARELNGALLHMHKQKKFAQMVFYMESCESGSMFKNLLPNDINIYAVTATNEKEASYSFYYDTTRKTFLGDTFSISWMEDTEASDLHTETLETQFQRVVKRTTKSHPQQFGYLTFSSFTLDKFMARRNALFFSPEPRGRDYETAMNNIIPFPSEATKKYAPSESVPSDMVPITILRHRLESAPENSPLRLKLEKELKDMEETHTHTYDLFWEISLIVTDGKPTGETYNAIFTRGQDINDFDCYEKAVDLLSHACSKVDTNVNSMFLRKLNVLVNLCNHQPSEKVFHAVEKAARNSPLCV